MPLDLDDLSSSSYDPDNFIDEDFNETGPIRLQTLSGQTPVEPMHVQNHFDRKLRAQCEVIAATKWWRARMISRNGGQPLNDSQVQELEAYVSRLNKAKGLA